MRDAVLVVAAGLLAAGFSQAFGQQPGSTLVVDGKPDCARCEIVLDRVFTVVDRGDSASIQTARAPVVDSRGRFYFQTVNGSNGIAVFDSTGVLVSRFGRYGQGPGEFGGLDFAMIMGKGDTLFICGARQCQLFSPDHRYVRAVPMPPASARLGAVVLADGDIAFRMRSPDSLLAGQPIHRMTTDGKFINAFGARVPFARECALCSVFTGLGVARNGVDVWVAGPGSYVLELWGERGEIKRRIQVRNSGWHVPWNPSVPSAIPMSRISKVVEQPDSVLLVFGTDARAAGDVPALPSGARVSTTEITRSTDVKRTLHIEAIDLKSRRILATKVAPGVYLSTFGADFVVTTRDGANGTFYVDVWRVSLKRPSAP